MLCCSQCSRKFKRKDEISLLAEAVPMTTQCDNCQKPGKAFDIVRIDDEPAILCPDCRRALHE
jgi:DNA-directed RNA polymerase subunit RPC12/RpoP